MLSPQTQNKVDALIAALTDRLIPGVQGAGELPLGAIDSLAGLIASSSGQAPDSPSPVCGFITPAPPEEVDDE